MNDFYVGYLPKMPDGLARRVRRIVLALAGLAFVVALLLALAQRPFALSFFEFGNIRSFEGTIVAKPYPLLLVTRPGKVEEGQLFSSYLLVAPGKHGADEISAPFDGKVVRLKGQLIYRDQKTMIEVEPGSITTTGVSGMTEGGPKDIGIANLSGEIVDSKCFLGVMNPAAGKVHRDCAVRCISGGVPPVFVSSDGRQFLLLDPHGQPITGNALRAFIAEPIRVTGRLLQLNDQSFLQLDPSTLRHNP